MAKLWCTDAERCREPDVVAFDRRTDAIKVAFDREVASAATRRRKPRTAAEVIAAVPKERKKK